MDTLREYKGKRMILDGKEGLCCGITYCGNMLIILLGNDEGWESKYAPDDFIYKKYIKEGNTYWSGSINNIELC